MSPISLPSKNPSDDHILRSPFEDIDIPDCTIDEYIWENVSKWEDKIALECGQTGQRLTYKQLRNKSRSLANSLSSLGLSGATALIVLPNCPEFPIALLGSLEAGMTVSSVNPVYTSGELKHQANDSKAKILITSPDSLDKVCSAELGLPIICTGDEQKKGVRSFNQMTEDGPRIATPSREERIKQLALLPYSSGTTGLPKGVRLSHKNVVANLAQMAISDICPIDDAIGDHQDVLPAIIPFFHIYGSTILMLRGLSKGAKLITLPKFDPPAFINILKNNKNIVLFAVPPIINYLGARPEVKPEYLEGLKLTLSGGAPLSVKEVEKYQAKKQHTVLQAYGMTESSPVLTYPPLISKNKATIGPLVANTFGRVIDLTDGTALPHGQHGELCFKGPQVMIGYHNAPEATAKTIDAEGWLHTGDIGYTDEEGNFYIVDRIKELIKVNGFQVAPAELEALLKQHPSVLDVGVTSIPSEKHGELPIAFIVPKPNEENDEDAISQWVARQVAPYKKLAKIITVSEIPKTTSGKILRRELKEFVKDIIM